MEHARRQRRQTRHLAIFLLVPYLIAPLGTTVSLVHHAHHLMRGESPYHDHTGESEAPHAADVHATRTAAAHHGIHARRDHAHVFDDHEHHAGEHAHEPHGAPEPVANTHVPPDPGASHHHSPALDVLLDLLPTAESAGGEVVHPWDHLAPPPLQQGLASSHLHPPDRHAIPGASVRIPLLPPPEQPQA